MPDFMRRLLDLFETIHPLDRVPRAGFLLRGVAEPESVSAHSHFVSLMALLVTDELPGEFDQVKVLAMALTHDLSESVTMDVPMPAADRHLREAKSVAEQAITEQMLNSFGARYAAYHREFIEASSPEARLLRGLDKAQMMIKVLMYEREHRGRLEEFWINPRNFEDFGVECVSQLFDAICAEAGRARPQRCSPIG
jgi:putative hydrolase of HD superfamily